MPEDVAFFVAKNVRANVRELEGALRKILAYSRFSHKDINIQLAREALKDLLSIQNRQVGVENIQKTVADFYKIKVADMYSKKRPASIARPRQIAMYIAKEMTQKSLPEIGELFGGRDHTTVLHAVRKIAAERAEEHRAQPAAARARADAEGLTCRQRDPTPVKRQRWGQLRQQPARSSTASAPAQSCCAFAAPREQARSHRLCRGAKCLIGTGENARCSTARPGLYYNDQFKRLT